MKTIEIANKKYEIIENNGNCLNKEEVEEKLTDYFDDYDYVFGDYSYGKMRLKGYYDSNHKKVKEINDIKGLEEYKKEYCSFGAKTFLLKKVK